MTTSITKIAEATLPVMLLPVFMALVLCMAYLQSMFGVLQVVCVNAQWLYLII